MYARLGAVLAQSEYEKRHLTDRGVSPEKIFVYGLGASSVPPTGDGAAFRARHGIGNRPVVLFIGRRQRYKGYHALAEAMAQVRESVPDALLVCVGPWGEPPYPELPEGALLDLGRVSEEEKEDALAACDVFCLPSTDESFGLVYVEAWRYGKPVIAGPAPAVREMVRDGENGYCLPQDPEYSDRLSLADEWDIQRGGTAHPPAIGKIHEYRWVASIGNMNRATFDKCPQNGPSGTNR